jgi:hypothetical protein
VERDPAGERRAARGVRDGRARRRELGTADRRTARSSAAWPSTDRRSAGRRPLRASPR